MKNSNCIIITQKEWLNWLAFGYLRVSPSRISYFDNTESSFDILMSYSVDNALDEEDAYLLASLVDEYSREELHIKRTPFSDHISIQAVQEFYSLSIKGHNLLKNEMEQSHSIVHYDSEIENLWSEWKNTQFRLRSLDKGNKFLEILGYPRFEVEPKLDDDTLFNKLLKNYNRRELPQGLQKHNKKNTFSWLVSNYEFSKAVDKSIYDQYKEWRNSSELSAIYNEQMSKYLATHDEYLIEQHSLIAEKIFFDSICKSEDSFLSTSFLVHYYNLLDNNLEIDLSFLKTDLAFLDEIYSTKDTSQLIAYFIGKRLNEVYLNFLYVAKNIDEKKSCMFDTNFFSNLKNEKLTLCNIEQVQLQDIISKVNVIAEQIQLAYNMEVNNVQNSELESDAIEGKDNNLNSPTESQAPRLDSDNSETNNTQIEKLDIANNTTNSDSTQPHSETEKSADSEESENNTKDMNKPDEIECDAKLSNISTTINNENETIKRDRVQKDKKSIDTSLNGDLFSLENTKQELSPINPTELLDDAISTIEELPEGKENHGGFFRDSLFSKNVRYKDEFKDLKLPAFFEAFAKVVGNDMKKHTTFANFKKELLSNE